MNIATVLIGTVMVLILLTISAKSAASRRGALAPKLSTSIAAMFLLLPTALSAEARAPEIPFRLENSLILVQGSIGNVAGLRFLIDTGATRTVIDKRLANRMGLQPGLKEYSMMAFGEKISAGKIRISGLRLGGFLARMDCYQADLSSLIGNVDGVIGLDLIRRADIYLADGITQQTVINNSLTIDYELGKIRFGEPESFEHEAMIEDSPGGILVNAKIDNQQIRLLVDTGAQFTTLFSGRQKTWAGLSQGVASAFHLGGAVLVELLLLPRLELGISNWTDLPGLLLDGRDQSADGMLAITPLDLRALHIDFVRKVMSWKR